MLAFPLVLFLPFWSEFLSSVSFFSSVLLSLFFPSLVVLFLLPFSLISFNLWHHVQLVFFSITEWLFYWDTSVLKTWSLVWCFIRNNRQKNNKQQPLNILFSYRIHNVLSRRFSCLFCICLSGFMQYMCLFPHKASSAVCNTTALYCSIELLEYRSAGESVQRESVHFSLPN